MSYAHVQTLKTRRVAVHESTMPTSRSIYQRIADEVGVAPRTVRRVLTEGLEYNRPTLAKRAARIRKLAEQMQYRPNAAGRAVGSGRFNALALVSREDLGGLAHLELIKGVCAELTRCNQHMHYAQVPIEDVRAGGLPPRMVQELSVDGLIVYYAKDMTADQLAVVRSQRAPVVWANLKDDSDCVHPDDRIGMQEATEYLLLRGHRRIALVTRDFGAKGDIDALAHYSVRDRIEGYTAAMSSAGAIPAVIGLLNRGGGDRERLDGLVAGDLPPTAIITVSSNDATLLNDVALRRGLRVPEDLSILTLHHASSEASQPLRFEARRVPMLEVGRAAVQMALHKVETPGRALPSQAVPFDRLPGRTVAAPASR